MGLIGTQRGNIIVFIIWVVVGIVLLWAIVNRFPDPEYSGSIYAVTAFMVIWAANLLVIVAEIVKEHGGETIR